MQLLLPLLLPLLPWLQLAVIQAATILEGSVVVGSSMYIVALVQSL